MEFLKDLFGAEALTYDQLAAKVAEKKMKLADISTGAYVGKEKFDALSLLKENLETRLNDANAKLEGYDPEWKDKAQQAKDDALAEVEKLKRGYLYQQKAAELKFSSESAKKAFLADLEAKKLPVQEDSLLGFDDFVKQYQKADPGAFLNEQTPPKFSGPTGGAPAGGTAKDQANAALRAAFGNSN